MKAIKDMSGEEQFNLFLDVLTIISFISLICSLSWFYSSAI
jgi:hypothetical protein